MYELGLQQVSRELDGAQMEAASVTHNLCRIGIGGAEEPYSGYDIAQGVEFVGVEIQRFRLSCSIVTVVPCFRTGLIRL